MFKNRKLEVKLVKDDQAETTTVPNMTSADYLAYAGVAIRKVAVGTVVVIATTVALTAAREIAVCKLTHPHH